MFEVVFRRQVDPKAEATKGMSPYCAMGNNPISNVDPNGDLFAIPKFSFNGGLSIGLEVGIGIPGVASLSASGMVGANSSWSVQGSAGGFYAGYGSGGAFAGVGFNHGGFSAGYEFTSGMANIGYGGSLGGSFSGSLGLSYGKGGFGYSLGASAFHDFTPNSNFQINHRIKQLAKQANSTDGLYAYQEVFPIIPLVIYGVPALKAIGAAVAVGVGYKVYVDVVVPEVIAYYKKINENKEADKAARDWGYEDAHDLKKDHEVGSEYDIYRDGKTGKGQLRPRQKRGKGEHKEIYPKYW